MRYICALLVFCLTCACGGGGGGNGTNNPPPNNPPPSGFDQIAQQLVEECGQDAVNELIAFIAIFEPLLNSGSSNPVQGFQVQGVDPGSASVFWDLDANLDAQPDYQGGFGFMDPTGAPGAPFDLNQLTGGLGNLANLLTQMLDGSNMSIDFQAISAVPITGQTMVVTFNGGTVAGIDGSIQIALASCFVEVQFQGASLQDIAGAIPTIDLDVTVQNNTNLASGTIMLDGTNNATVTLTPDGAPQSFTFLVNLTTGVVTPVP